MVTVDGSQGEGGGQVLRTALGLSLVTGQPVRIVRIRAKRKKPGLMRQHLTSVRAAAQIGQARVEGASLGSRELTFTPGDVRPGSYHFAVGTAGSATLVLQTVLPALLCASGPSRLRLEGGTHNPFAPPFDFLDRTFLPLVNRLGPRVEAELARPGFYPVGGGEIAVSITPTTRLEPLELPERGPVRRINATAHVARLPPHIAERELNVIRARLGLDVADARVEEVADSRGPGNVVLIEVESEHVTEVLTGFGQRGKPAERVAEEVAGEAQRYLDAGVPVGEHLADQLLAPLALAGRGAFRTLDLTPHARTNMDVIGTFLDVEFVVRELEGGHLVEIEAAK